MLKLSKQGEDMKNFVKLISICLIICLLGVSFVSCGEQKGEFVADGAFGETTETTAGTNSNASAKEETEQTVTSKEYTAVITVKNYGEIEVKLDGKTAPITVENFVKLANEKFYDGLTFHRIISGFMIQGGDPKGDGTGGSDKEIKGEFSANGVANNISHKRGVISMARNSISMDSASSQFFIMHQDAPHLDGQYAAFGYVTKGMEVVDKIAAEIPVVDDNGTVLKESQPVIQSVVIK